MATPSQSVLFAGSTISYIAFDVTVTDPEIDLTKVRVRIRHPSLEDTYWTTIGFETATFYDEFNHVVKVGENSYILFARVTYVPAFGVNSRTKSEPELRFFEARPAPVESDIYIDGEFSQPTNDVFIFT